MIIEDTSYYLCAVLTKPLPQWLNVTVQLISLSSVFILISSLLKVLPNFQIRSEFMNFFPAFAFSSNYDS